MEKGKERVLTLRLRVAADGNSKDARNLELGGGVVVDLTDDTLGEAIGVGYAILLAVGVPRVDGSIYRRQVVSIRGTRRTYIRIYIYIYMYICVYISLQAGELTLRRSLGW